jgi:hypothetical protein
MALTCPADLTGVDIGFESFIDCATISINMDLLGTATVSFTVVSKYREPTPENYTELTFGGVVFTGHVTSLDIKRIPGTLVYEHIYSISAVGC